MKWLLHVSAIGVLLLGVLALPNETGGAAKWPQGPAPLAKCWEELASTNAEQAYAAMGQLVEHPSQAVQLLAKHLTPAAAPDEKKMQVWVLGLRSPKFAVRQESFHELEKQGELAEPALRQALAAKLDLETRRRIDLLLERIPLTTRVPEKLRLIRAVEVLEMLNTKEARALLQHLAKGFIGHRLTREAQESWQRLQRRPPLAPGVHKAPPKLSPSDKDEEAATPTPFTFRALPVRET